MKIQRVVPCVAGARLGDKPMSGTFMTNDRIAEVMKRALDRERPPARLNGEQTADLLGFEKDDLTLLARAGLLAPLGNPTANCHRAVENQPQRGGSNPASLRCLFDRVFEVEGQESVGG